MRILPAHVEERPRVRTAVGRQRRIVDPVDYMQRARAHHKKRECGAEHDWDGPIQPTDAGVEYRFSYCRHCKAIKWAN